MSGYVRSSKAKVEFDGDTVTVTVKALEWGDIVGMRAGMQDGVELVSAFAALLPKYVESIEGLTDASGTPITVEEVAKMAYFRALVTDIMAHCMDKSRVADPIKSGEKLTGFSPDTQSPKSLSASLATESATG